MIVGRLQVIVHILVWSNVIIGFGDVMIVYKKESILKVFSWIIPREIGDEKKMPLQRFPI